MITSITQIFAKRNILTHENEGITIAAIKNHDEARSLLAECLYALVDRKTALYLSGGKTPKELYTRLAREETLIAGAAGQVDERYGLPFHANSNQKMIKETGLLRYFEMRNIPFYPMLQNKTREQTADLSDEKIRTLHATFQKSIALLGIGSDGHIAGIAGNRKDFQNPLFDKERKDLLVSEYNDTNGMFKERITMTFLGLSMIDILLVVVLGDDKKQALENMFTDGSEEEVPARFYKRPGIAEKTIVVTDQGFLI